MYVKVRGVIDSGDGEVVEIEVQGEYQPYTTTPVEDYIRMRNKITKKEEEKDDSS